jgi:hypothetical protein
MGLCAHFGLSCSGFVFIGDACEQEATAAGAWPRQKVNYHLRTLESQGLSKVEEREGGATVTSFGPGMDAVAKITAWNPPKSFVAETEGGRGEEGQKKGITHTETHKDGIPALAAWPGRAQPGRLPIRRKCLKNQR